MEKGLLARLVSYSPSPAKTQVENFLTETFAFILERHPQILGHALAVAGNRGRLRGKLPSLDCAQGISVRTQASFEDRFGRPDMLVFTDDGHPRLVIENKLDAGFTWREVGPEESAPSDGDSTPSTLKSQLENYLELVRHRGWDAQVLLLSTSPRDLPVAVTSSPGYLGNMLWRDVFEATAVFQRQASDALVDQFLLLMEELKMKDPTPIYPCEASVYHEYTALQARATLLVDRVADALAGRFGFTKQNRESKHNYAYRMLVKGDLQLFLSFFFANSDPNEPPDLLSLAVLGDSDLAKKAARVLACSGNREGWSGRFTYMSSDQKKRLISQLEWEEQVEAATQIALEWMKALADERILEVAA